LSLSLRFPLKPAIHVSSPHMRYMAGLMHSSRYDHPHNVWWAAQIIKLLIMEFSPFPYYLVPLSSEYSPQHLILKHPQPTSWLHSASIISDTLLSN
jgi:hypothetical protein